MKYFAVAGWWWWTFIKLDQIKNRNAKIFGERKFLFVPKYINTQQTQRPMFSMI